MNKLRLAVLAVAATLLGACGPTMLFVTNEKPYRLPNEEPQAGSLVIWHKPNNTDSAIKVAQQRCGGPTKVAHSDFSPVKGLTPPNGSYSDVHVCVDDGTSLSLR